jgi:hypothetical protein
MSNLRCKPGDLAVVIHATFKTNLGRIVRVIRPSCGEGDLTYPAHMNTWLVESAEPLTWYRGKKRFRRKSGPVPDAQLQPIRGCARKSKIEKLSLPKKIAA